MKVSWKLKHILCFHSKKIKIKINLKKSVLQELSKYSEETMYRVIYMHTCKYFPYFGKFVSNQDYMLANLVSLVKSVYYQCLD